MPTATGCKFEYRCVRCFHSLYAIAEEAGTIQACPYCGEENALPEATPDRIARAEKAFDASAVPRPAPSVFNAPPMSNAEMLREVKEQLYVPPSEMQSLCGIASSPMKRFFGMLIDGLLMGLAAAAGIATFLALTHHGFISETPFEASEFNLDTANAYGAIYFPLAALLLFQWNLISVQGQSIGKLLLGMKIVTDSGLPPGFVQGVVLRNWLRTALNMIPFFGFIDAITIFGQSHRCVHDFLAGTHVVDAY